MKLVPSPAVAAVLGGVVSFGVGFLAVPDPVKLAGLVFSLMVPIGAVADREGQADVSMGTVLIVISGVLFGVAIFYSLGKWLGQAWFS